MTKQIVSNKFQGERELEQMIKIHRVRMVMAMPDTLDSPASIEYVDKFYQDTINGQIWHQRVHYQCSGSIESTATPIGYPLYNSYVLDYMSMVKTLRADDKKVQYFINCLEMWCCSLSKSLSRFNKMILTTIRFMLKDKRIPKEDNIK